MDTKHTVYLHGTLGKQYGKKPFTIYGTDIRDVVKGLCTNLGEGFKNTIKNNNWHITTGKREKNLDKPIPGIDNDMKPEEVELAIRAEEIHIFPQVKGAGRGGILGIIVGVVLIIVGIVLLFTPFAALGYPLIAAGIGMVAGGIVQMLNAPPKVGQYQNAEVAQRPSFLFNGIVNTVEQGGPVPLVYGRHLTGSTVISAGMTVEQI